MTVEPILGLEADAADGGGLTIDPLDPAPWDWLSVDGLRIGERTVSIVTDDEHTDVEVSGPDLRIHVD